MSILSQILLAPRVCVMCVLTIIVMEAGKVVGTKVVGKIAGTKVVGKIVWTKVVGKIVGTKVVGKVVGTKVVEARVTVDWSRTPRTPPARPGGLAICRHRWVSHWWRCRSIPHRRSAGQRSKPRTRMVVGA